jgi:hypothetical protein
MWNAHGLGRTYTAHNATNKIKISRSRMYRRGRPEEDDDRLARIAASTARFPGKLRRATQRM